MMLADPAVVREQLGFDDMTDINDAIEAAMFAATQALSARLNTSFDRGTSTDTWYVYEPVRSVGQLRQTEFRTRQGFIQELTAITYAAEISQFGTVGALSVASSVSLHGEKGVISDMYTDYTSMFVRATYTYGFEPDATYDQVYAPEQVPGWLKEAAKMQALVLLANNPAIKQAEVVIDSRTYQRTLDQIVGQHVRYTPLAILPL